MTFNQYKNSLNKKMHEPLPQKEMNNLVIQRENLDQVANRCQRLIVKVINEVLFYTENLPDDTLMEYVQVCNVAIAESIFLYKEEKIDFAYFVYMQMLNELRSYIKHTKDVVKSRVVDKKRLHATYLYIDGQEDDEEKFDVEQKEEEKEMKINLQDVYSILAKEKHPVKKKNWDLFVYKTGLEDGFEKRTKDVAQEYGMTVENVRLLCNKIISRIKSNEKLLKYFSNIIE